MDVEEEPAIKGDIYTALLQGNLLLDTTNFTQNTLISIYRDMQPFLQLAGTRGPQPKSSPMDQLICYLAWGKLSSDIDVLAKILNIKPNRLEDNIHRIRTIVNKTLRFRWWSPIARPRYQDGSPFPNVALIIDNHTSEVFRPKDPFGEAKIYWDGKNKIYGLKNECAIMATTPHYFTHINKEEVASIHDYQYHKGCYVNYLDYLLRLADEAHHLQGDLHHRFWAVMGDKAYIGPPTDTPDLRRICPKKGTLLMADRTRNEEINKARVPIECAFGRVLKKWGVARNIYRYDHAHFQTDFENWCLLTNEDIRVWSFFGVISLLLSFLKLCSLI